MKISIRLLAILSACFLLSACATKAPPWQSASGQAPDAMRLEQAKVACDHDAKLKKSSSMRANGVMVARYDGGNTSGPLASKWFEKAAVLRQEVSDCMKAQGFVLLAR